MFVSFRHRLFSSATSSGAGGNFTLQQAGRELARAFAQKAHPKNKNKAFYELSPEFVKTIDLQRLRADLLDAEVQKKAEQDTESKDEIQKFVTTKYIKQVIKEAGTLIPPLTKKQLEAQPVEPVVEHVEQPWEKKRDANIGTITAVPRPVELIKTGQEIHFMNGYFLTRFVSEGGKILPRWKSGLSAKQQRKLSREVRKSRQLGLIPVVQKFLPAFEANLSGQSLPNPLAGLVHFPKKAHFEEVSEAAREQEEFGETISKIRTEIAAERASPVKITFGIPEIDDLKTETDLLNFLNSVKQPVPELYSINRLRCRAAQGYLRTIDMPVVQSFLAAREVDVADCTKDSHLRVRAVQILLEFEENVFPDSPLYNGVRFDNTFMSRLNPRPFKKRHNPSPSSAPMAGGGGDKNEHQPPTA